MAKSQNCCCNKIIGWYWTIWLVITSQAYKHHWPLPGHTVYYIFHQNFIHWRRIGRVLSMFFLKPNYYNFTSSHDYCTMLKRFLQWLSRKFNIQLWLRDDYCPSENSYKVNSSSIQSSHFFLLKKIILPIFRSNKNHSQLRFRYS
jgi:hypothetical protein